MLLALHTLLLLAIPLGPALLLARGGPTAAASAPARATAAPTAGAAA
jgi:hypothetical protein